jgi:hypothetical protein
VRDHSQAKQDCGRQARSEGASLVQINDIRSELEGRTKDPNRRLQTTPPRLFVGRIDEVWQSQDASPVERRIERTVRRTTDRELEVRHVVDQIQQRSLGPPQISRALDDQHSLQRRYVSKPLP